MQAFLVSLGVVALAEMGDKTQLLALVLAARFRRPVPIIAGILAATMVNHALAGAVGAWLLARLGPVWLRWILGLSFIGMAVWTLVPDRQGEADTARSRLGVFGATALSFFLAEMGDKTQFATVALAAHFHTFYAVVAGTTCGMLLADVPAVLLGERILRAVPLPLMRTIAAAVFALLGALALRP
jgi:putative Ca2+/H+ antiporter (TMEM165/GDT1 family)